VWGAEIEDDADDVQKAERDSRYEHKDNKMSNLARFWLPEQLKKGQRRESELAALAQEQEGISIWQLRRIKGELGVVSKRVGKEWYWSLPVPEPVAPGVEVL
jgi:hypothetical protein